MSVRTIDITVPAGTGFTGRLSLPPSGKGPGLLVLQEIFGVNANIRAICDRFAEEGYVVLAPDVFWRQKPGVDLGYSEADFGEAFGLYKGFDVDQGVADIGAAIAALRALPECTGKVGVIGYCLGGLLTYLTAARHDIDAASAYYGGGIDKYLAEAGNVRCPIAFHFGGADSHIPPASVEAVAKAFADVETASVYVYPGADHAFANADRPSFDKPTSMMAYSRSLAVFRAAMGPRFDLSKMWDEHTLYEFGTRDVAATMATMVAEPYVNHVPTMTGGVGARDLSRFYANHFIPRTPADTRLVPISRTIGADRLVDEMLFCFTHDIEIDWMLPGVKPTGKYVEIPLVSIVNFRGGKLYREHIYWDQASVLVQIGLLDPKGLPVAGIETAKKLVDETLPSNLLMSRWANSAPLAAE
jgi:carboxymethylenebutenolidase